MCLLPTSAPSCTDVHAHRSAGICCKPHSHAHCTPGIYGTWTHIPTAPLSTLNAPPHTYTLYPRNLQEKAVTGSRSHVGSCRHLHVHVQCTPLSTACINLHCTICLLQTPALTCPLSPPSALCRYLYSPAHCPSVFSTLVFI